MKSGVVAKLAMAFARHARRGLSQRHPRRSFAMRTFSPNFSNSSTGDSTFERSSTADEDRYVYQFSVAVRNCGQPTSEAGGLLDRRQIAVNASEIDPT
jgi:hypothetical protein